MAACSHSSTGFDGFGPNRNKTRLPLSNKRKHRRTRIYQEGPYRDPLVVDSSTGLWTTMASDLARPASYKNARCRATRRCPVCLWDTSDSGGTITAHRDGTHATMVTNLHVKPKFRRCNVLLANGRTPDGFVVRGLDAAFRLLNSMFRRRARVAVWGVSVSIPKESWCRLRANPEVGECGRAPGGGCHCSERPTQHPIELWRTR